MTDKQFPPDSVQPSSEKRHVTAGDCFVALVFIAAIVLSLGLAGVPFFSWADPSSKAASLSRSKTMRALINVDGTEYVYPLDEDRTLEFTGAQGPAVLVIENGSIRFEDSTCRDLTCVHMGKVGPDEAHFAACLPNRIIVTLEGAEEPLSNAGRQGDADALDW